MIRVIAYLKYYATLLLVNMDKITDVNDRDEIVRVMEILKDICEKYHINIREEA